MIPSGWEDENYEEVPSGFWGLELPGFLGGLQGRLSWLVWPGWTEPLRPCPVAASCNQPHIPGLSCCSQHPAPGRGGKRRAGPMTNESHR